MAKKVRIELTYAREKLWWSVDGGSNWGIVGPQSPYTLLDKDAEVSWIADKTISELTITYKKNDLMEAPEGGKKDKKAKVKQDRKKGDKCKYDITIVVASSKETKTFDPDMDYCDPITAECMG
tara:strand:+ start:69 stop:437 length:369 start_codon:yes stop_codon:yes gene_type:complete